jgi:hypothetical protein
MSAYIVNLLAFCSDKMIMAPPKLLQLTCVKPVRKQLVRFGSLAHIWQSMIAMSAFRHKRN